MAGARPRVVIAGASGFIGSRLIEALRADCDIIGLTRHPKADEPGLQWRHCDLFSLLQAEQALAGADYAFYLVHSMMPMARLTQGSFQDMDLILADNFARAAAHAGIRQIVYLGGIIPPSGQLSLHLRSRLEVEHTLAAHGVPVTRIRASIIIGPRGSSFQIIEKLVRRLPVLLCPLWTRSKTQPIALDDVLQILKQVLGQPEHFAQAYDVGGPDVVSYVELMRSTARALGKRRWILPVPFISPALSRLWVSLIASAPRELVIPLIESLKDPMVAGDLRLQQALNLPGLPLQAALKQALEQQQQFRPSLPPKAIRHRGPYTQSLQFSDGIRHAAAKDVRSVQRLPLPPQRNAIWVAEKYTIWLPRFLKPWMRVEVDSARVIHFYLLGLPWPLLELSYAEARSSPDRALFYITGGLLARTDTGLRGRLEFREVPGGNCVLAAIHDFTPRLPWFIYNRSQALVHLWVMHAFGRYLHSLDVRPF